jgi:hypothetical protein
MLFATWFIIYWILGGVFFALVAATRFMHTRKAMFSCLFTIGSVGAAYGASITGIILAAHDVARRCAPSQSPSALSAFGDLITCHPGAVFVAGGMFFALLLTTGMVALLVSRVEKGK